MSGRTQCQTLIVGAGITGLTIARELAQRGHEDILVLDKESDLGAHASGRNSGVLHAGVYYHPGTLKARFCLEGNRLLKDYCRNRDLTLVECGKVIVSKNERELEGLEELKRRCDATGAEVSMIDPAQLAAIEPHATTKWHALYSPNTAVFRPEEILAALAQDLTESGRVQLRLGTEYEGLAGEQVATTDRGQIRFDRLLNAAGAHADRIAHEFGLGREYRSLPFKGTYMKLREGRTHLVRGNIYPVPDLRNPFLGVHFTRGADGDVYVGPTAIPAFGRENYGLLEGLDREAPEILFRDAVMFLQNPAFRSAALEEPRKLLKGVVFRQARKLLPELAPGDLRRSDKVGIRAQLVHWPSRQLAKDFVVERDETSLHILNAISPGFTSSMAFARHIVDQLDEGSGEAEHAISVQSP